MNIIMNVVSNNNLNCRILMVVGIGSQKVTTVKGLGKFVNYSVL